MMSDDAILQQLRDIHLPAPISWWPPAWGWWCCGVGLLLMVFFVFHYWRTRKIRRLKTSIEKTLQVLSSQEDDLFILQSLSQLLRRVALHVFPHEPVASLVGENWLAFLDRAQSKVVKTRDFSEGIGRCFLTAPYLSRQDLQLNAEWQQKEFKDALLSLVRCWVSVVLKVHARHVRS
jgi:hypothetical protein